MLKPSVIVVNSLVSRGSVGGRAVMFALERLGFPVIFMPTVILPWHPGHGRATRILPREPDFAGLAYDLADARWLGEVGAVATGYFGEADQIEAAALLIGAVRRANPQALFLCDPVIGDGESLFVAEAIAAAVRDRLLPMADIATPNRFELSWLTRQTGRGVVAAARELGPREVVVTSASADAGGIGNLLVHPEGVDVIAHEAAGTAPNGTGDLLAALYLGHRLDGAAPPLALARSVSAVRKVVTLAAELGADELPLTAAQDAFAAEPEGIVSRRIAGARK